MIFLYTYTQAKIACLVLRQDKQTVLVSQISIRNKDRCMDYLE